MSHEQRTSRTDIHDPSLRSTLDQVAPHIEYLAENLDTVFADIKALEGYLERSAARIKVSHKFAESPELAGD